MELLYKKKLNEAKIKESREFLVKVNRDDRYIELAPLSQVPLSTQLDYITGDSYNTSDFMNYEGSGLDASSGNIIVHKKSGVRFLIP